MSSVSLVRWSVSLFICLGCVWSSSLGHVMTAAHGPADGRPSIARPALAPGVVSPRSRWCSRYLVLAGTPQVRAWVSVCPHAVVPATVCLGGPHGASEVAPVSMAPATGGALLLGLHSQGGQQLPWPPAPAGEGRRHWDGAAGDHEWCLVFGKSFHALLSRDRKRKP